MDVAVRLLLLLFFLCAWLIWKHAEGRRLMGGIAAVLLLGLPVGAAAFWKKGDEEKAAVQCLNAEWLARQMHGYQGLFAREGPGQGDGGQFRLPGEHSLHQQFPAHDEHRPFPFSEEPGIPGRVYAHLWTGGNPVFRPLLGHGFVLASRPVEGMEDVLSRDGMYLYRLPGAQWGRVVPESALGLELDDKASVFENLNVLYARLFPSGKSPLYVPAEARTEVCGNAYSMRIPERDGDVYGFPLTDTDELKVDGREVPVMAEAQKKPGWKGRTYNGTLD